MMMTLLAALGKVCVFNRMHACPSGEMCLSRNDSVHGYCICISGYSRDRASDTCMPASTVIPILEPGMSTTYVLNIFSLPFIQSLCFRLVQAFAGISLASSGLLASPMRSRDRLDDDQMTAVVHRRRGELVSLVAVHGRLSYFNFDGFSHFSL